MDSYDPLKQPNAAAWLVLDEGERLDMITEYHQLAGVELPSELMHATMHMIVENQIAEGVEQIQAAEARLKRQGLDRHDAVHAIAAVLAEQIHDVLGEETSRCRS